MADGLDWFGPRTLWWKVSDFSMAFEVPRFCPICCDTYVTSCGTCQDKGKLTREHGLVMRERMKFVKMMEKFYNVSTLSDVILSVNDKVYRAHRFLLCIQSDVFRAMLSTDSRWSEVRCSTLVLQEDAICEEAFPSFLKYFYCGQVKLSMQTVLPILVLADKYQVENLQVACIEFMLSHFSSCFTNCNVFSWLRYTKVSGHNVLHREILNFINCNFIHLVGNDDFYSIECDLLLQLLKQSCLVVPSEYQLFVALIHWIQEQDNFSTAEPHITDRQLFELINEIRYPMMSTAELSLLHDLDMVKSHRDWFTPRIELSLKYHAVQCQDTHTLTGFTGLEHCLQPRIYTHLCTDININNFTNRQDFSHETFTLSTPVSLSGADATHICKWQMDVYPKGVYYDKFYLLHLFRRQAISGSYLEVFRVKVQQLTNCDVQIALKLLVMAKVHKVEFVQRVVHKVLTFDVAGKIHNLDDVLHCVDLNDLFSEYKVGDDNNTIKLKAFIQVLHRKA